MASSRIPVPDAIRRIADSEDRKLAWYFFVFFSRFEYALKRTPRYLKPGVPDAQANWDRFGSVYTAHFLQDAPAEVHRAVDYFRSEPPKKQINCNGMLKWSEPLSYEPNEPLLIWLLRMIRCVRNNLFHGGKLPLIAIADVSRDRDLLIAAMTILEKCLELDNALKQYFMESIDEEHA